MSAGPDTFARLAPLPADALLALIALCRADLRAEKIDVGVGVYRDEAGATTVLRAVKAAEDRLVAEQSSKAYLGAEGDQRFIELLAPIVFGAGTNEPHRFGLQTPGGTGALRLGAELLARTAPAARVWIGTPTWPNHAPIFAEAGLTPAFHPYYDATSGGIAFSAMLEALHAAMPGDAVLLHGCSHNPTGTELSIDEWRAVAAVCTERGLLPFVDLAYQGLGDGLEEDVAGMRLLLDSVPDSLVAYSCDKNFALYRERVGALWIQTRNPARLAIARDNLLALARSLWSMPPDHGAATVRIVLDDPDLADMWRAELATMRQRLNSVRTALAVAHPGLAGIAAQRGLFSLLPITSQAVKTLREAHGIYMADNARINVAGLNAANLARFTDALTPFLDGDQPRKTDNA